MCEKDIPHEEAMGKHDSKQSWKKCQQIGNIYCPAERESHHDISPIQTFRWLFSQLLTEIAWETTKWEQSDDPSQPKNHER